MRVQFTYNQEDWVDSMMRFMRRSKTSRSVRWQATIYITLFCWLAIYLVFVSFLKNPYLAIIVAVVTTVSNVALSPYFHEYGIKKRLRKFLRESYGNRNDFACEVELTPAHIQVRQDNTQTVFDWKDVDEITVTEDSVDIFVRLGGVIIRNRAFESTNMRDEFIALARSFAPAHKE